MRVCIKMPFLICELSRSCQYEKTTDRLHSITTFLYVIESGSWKLKKFTFESLFLLIWSENWTSIYVKENKYPCENNTTRLTNLLAFDYSKVKTFSSTFAQTGDKLFLFWNEIFTDFH